MDSAAGEATAFTFRFYRRTSGNRGVVFRRLFEQAVVRHWAVTESDLTSPAAMTGDYKMLGVEELTG